MKENMERNICGCFKRVREILLIASACLCIILFTQGVLFGQTEPSKKVFGFSNEILPTDEEESIGISAERYEERAKAKRDLIGQKVDRQELMMHLKQEPSRMEGDVPLKKKAAVIPGGEITETEQVAEIEGRESEILEAPEFVELKPVEIVPAAPEPSQIEPVRPNLVEPAETVDSLKPADIAVPIGSVLLMKNGADVGGKMYKWIGNYVGDARKDLTGETLSIKVAELPKELQVSAGVLLEVKGVAVEVPGTEYAVAKTSEKVPEMMYNVTDNLFTIDEITLEKKKTGELLVRVPQHVEKDLNGKKLCLSREKNNEGKTIKERLEDGDIKALAMVLAEWARYEKTGFKFGSESEEVVAKALIRIVGVGVETAVVRLEENETNSKILENEIGKIIGDDEEAWSSIMNFMYPKTAEDGLGSAYSKGNKNK